MKNTLLFICKNFGTFANRKYEKLSYPQKSENVRPYSGNSIACEQAFGQAGNWGEGKAIFPLLKILPRYSQPSRENATPSSGTSPLASYKEVHPSGSRA